MQHAGTVPNYANLWLRADTQWYQPQYSHQSSVPLPLAAKSCPLLWFSPVLNHSLALYFTSLTVTMQSAYFRPHTLTVTHAYETRIRWQPSLTRPTSLVIPVVATRHISIRSPFSQPRNGAADRLSGCLFARAVAKLSQSRRCCRTSGLTRTQSEKKQHKNARSHVSRAGGRYEMRTERWCNQRKRKGCPQRL